ncbi:MAG: NAD(P)H-hydrate dehydratase [Bacteroidales bacterium]|nr:NAD(P)H-hydrate dehydratase [Bacteroidales bacterium]
MQKIFTVEQIREADQYTIQNEPIASIDLMERAAAACVNWIAERAAKDDSFAVFCGPGNNGGDGLAIARLLSERDFTVHVYLLEANRYSEDYQTMLTRLKVYKGVGIVTLSDSSDFPEINPNTILIDALFGSGLSKVLTGLAAKLISFLNKQNALRLAIDIPSGIFADTSSLSKNSVQFKADYTLSFQFPKKAFFMPENDFFVGDWHVLNIGLSNEYIQNTASSFYLIESMAVKQMLRKRPKFSHKGSFGHGLLIAGSLGKMGAAVLAGKAALRSGAGLITAHHPKAGMEIIPNAAPEVMSSLDANDAVFSALPDLSKYHAIAIGPGLGTDKKTQIAFKLLIQESHIPLVIDADGINLLAENKTWLAFLPSNSILTPHVKEFERLIGKVDNDFERLEKQMAFAKKHRIYLVLKGAHTSIATPEGTVFFNSTGNPGMATGGSGDVLTGMILGLKAQNYSSLESVLMAVYLHGLAGDLASESKGQISMIAGDLIDFIPEAFLSLMNA